MTSHAPTRPRLTPLGAMLLGGLVPGGSVLLGAPLLTWAAAGSWAAVSSLIGGVISLAVFLLGVIGIRGVLAGPTAATMAGAFGVFVLQMAVLAAVIWSLGQTTWLQVVPLGITFIIVGLAFQAGLVVGYLHSRPALDVELPGEGR